MQAILQHHQLHALAAIPARPLPEDIADLLGLERQLEEMLSTGTFVAPPSLISLLLGNRTPRTRRLKARDRVRFERMLAEVKEALDRL